MSHKAEQILVAIHNALVTALPTYDIARDRPYDVATTTVDAITILMGPDTVLGQNLSYTDHELDIIFDLFVRSNVGVAVSTKLNALRALIVQTMAPSNNSANSYGVAGAYASAEGNTSPEEVEIGDTPTGAARMLFYVKYRVPVNNPELSP